MTPYSAAHRSALSQLVLVLALLLPIAAFAQAQPNEDDLRALRFYITEDSTAAISAEIRRLQGVFPGWTPPEDLTQLLQTGPSGEIDNIYARIAAGDIAGARQLLATTRVQFPNWIPPADMIASIDLAEAQSSFDAALTIGDAAAAVRLASATPALLRCDRINNTWELAELQSAAGNTAGALVAYRQIVIACPNVTDIISTIEKADAIASILEITALLNEAKQRFTADAVQFDQLQNRILAGRGIAAPATPAPVTRVATTTPPAVAVPVPPVATTAPVTPTAVAPAPVAPNLSVSSVGTVQLGRLPRSGDGRLSQIRAAALAGNFRECLARSAQPRSLDVVYERAWCAYNLDRPLEALAHFIAAAGGGLGETVTRDARFGMALSFLDRHMTDDASQIAASTDLTHDQRLVVESIILDQRGVRAYQQEEYQRAITFFDGLEALEGSLRRDLAILRAYSYINLGDVAEGRRQFQVLDDALSTEETRAGLRGN